ncbi:MAG TPA: hypothetical protein VLA19_16020 [Herpetosiphonaceae bacterium]|nr:hypothetical protein [Herpetosiphonaceae bacterium]
MSEQYLVDPEGKTIGVVLDVDTYNHLRDAASTEHPYPIGDSLVNVRNMRRGAEPGDIIIDERERLAIIEVLNKIADIGREVGSALDDSLTSARAVADQQDLIGELFRRFSRPEQPPAHPVTDEERAQIESWLASSDELARRISAAWKDDMSAVEAVQEQRREL